MLLLYEVDYVPTSKSLSILFCFKYNICILEWQSVDPPYMVPTHYRLTMYIISFHFLNDYYLYMFIYRWASEKLEPLRESQQIPSWAKVIDCSFKIGNFLGFYRNFHMLSMGLYIVHHTCPLYIYLFNDHLQLQLQFAIYFTFKFKMSPSILGSHTRAPFIWKQEQQ